LGYRFYWNEVVVMSKDPDVAKLSLPPLEFREEFHADSVNDK